jgi:hypothetical protein
MKVLALVLVLSVVPGGAITAARAADDSKVKAGTHQVESGARKIGDGKVTEGVEETAKGVGKTVEEGAKFTGEKLKESGKAAEPQARTAWGKTRDGAVAFGHSVKAFFSELFVSH